jgi:two-component system, OmpR family, osmolarity sensor histidine kinase EnvZ
MPTGLLARAMIIIIVPMVILQTVIGLAFMDRHWLSVTRRLSASVAQDISAVIDMINAYPQDPDYDTVSRIAFERLQLDIEMEPRAPLPAPLRRPFLSRFNDVFSEQIKRRITSPLWIDTQTNSSIIQIKIELPQGVLSVKLRSSLAYASNSHIFIVWMLGTAIVLLTIAIIFMRNQIKPIERLAEAAESFGMGRDVDFRPRGAREVRRAGVAFLEMKRRIERAMQQRTTMLSGVSHDLRTIITRFRLSLAIMDETPEIEDLRRDIDEMSRMLEGYLAFARGDDPTVNAVETNLIQFFEELRLDFERSGHSIQIHYQGDPLVMLRVDSFKRCLTNLLANAARYAHTVQINGERDHRWLTIHVDDDGPGIPANQREEVFRPFFRLDEARTVDEGGSGLGLPIALDIARAHGGDLSLSQSPLGGLRASVKIPV